jgi:hypothetical protein
LQAVPTPNEMLNAMELEQQFLQPSKREFNETEGYQFLAAAYKESTAKRGIKSFQPYRAVETRDEDTFQNDLRKYFN